MPPADADVNGEGGGEYGVKCVWMGIVGQECAKAEERWVRGEVVGSDEEVGETMSRRVRRVKGIESVSVGGMGRAASWLEALFMHT